MLKTQMIGNLTADPKEVVTRTGVSMVSLTVAHNKAPDKNGERKAVFVECIAFRSRPDPNTGRMMGRDLGGIILKHFRKGDSIYLEGEPYARAYKNRNGEAVPALCMTVTDFQFCGGKKHEEAPQEEPPRDPQTGYEMVETDELPF